MKKANKKYLLYSLIIAVLFILSNYIVKFSFNIGDTSVFYSVFSIPFIYLFTYLLYKKFGFKKSFIAIIGAVILQLLVFLIEWLITSQINTGVLVGTMLSVPFAQLLLIGLITLLQKFKFENIISIFVALSVAVLFDNLVFLNVMKLFGNNDVVINMINISNLIKIVLAFVSSLVVSKLKK